MKRTGKQDKETRKSSRRLTAAAAGSVAVVFVLSFWAGIRQWQGSAGGEDTAAEETAVSDGVEYGAVLNPQNQAVHTMLNKPASKPEGKDERTVFKIIEVIPHEACSVFPYLVEWGSEEEYDKNVTIGYEGLMALTSGWEVFMFSDENVKAKSSAPYTIAKESVQQSVLKNYDIPMSAASNPNGKWYRKTQDDKDGLITEDGYFEYVGEGKGLYYLSASYATDDPDGRGIRYETKAVARKGTENPKGELYVADGAYYVSREHQSSARPNFQGKQVVSQTGYHYELSFAEDSAGSYAADVDHIKVSEKPEYGYHLIVEDAATGAWDTGFTYAAGGNYTVAGAVKNNAGRYVRISDDTRPDGFTQSGLDTGYFRLAKAEDGGAERYYLTFQQTAGGSYYANKPAVWDASAAALYHFQFAGEKKGFYDVPFYYSVSSTNHASLRHYGETLLWLEHGKGSYALASTAKTEAGNPVYRKKDGTHPADYSNMVTNISFRDEVTGGKDATFNKDDPGQVGIGVSLGGYDAGLDTEKGGFIFVPVSDKADMKDTPLSRLPENTADRNSNTDSYYQVGDRIYVTGQKRRYRYYCRDGFYNNDWFKLLCYSNHPKDPNKPYTEIIDGIGYDYNKTPGENLADPNTKALLRAFEQNMRIEIVQITPEKLTPADVRSAQLIYISNEEGLQNLSGKWNQISAARVQTGLEPLASCNWSGTCSSYGDLSDETLMELYEECVWTRNRALIANINIINSVNNTARTNLEKLGYFMAFLQEPRSWASFMPDQYPDVYDEDFTRIRSDASVEVCKTVFNNQSGYNWGFEESEAVSHNSWNRDYFKVYKKGTPWNPNIVTGFEYEDYLGINIGVVREDETMLIMDYWVPGFLQKIGNSRKIWQIIQNSQEDRSVLAVEVLNAEMTADAVPQLLIYGDEYDQSSFELIYRVKIYGNSGVKPELNVTLAWEDGSELGVNSNAGYGVEYQINTRKGFTTDGTRNGTLNPSAAERTLVITAENANGKTAGAEVTVMVREGFDLN